jgi:ActR/RegA family two-component response regulator
MDISCTHCKTSFVFPDDRIPETKKFKLNCPKCREPIIIDQGGDRVVPPEHFPHDATVAFLFVRDKALAARVTLFMKSRGIFVSEARQVHEAIDKVRINYYNILILEDTEASRAILDIVKKWNGLRRREVNIILVESASQSLRADEAFYRGVNAVIGQGDTERIESMLELAMDEFKTYFELWAVAAQKLEVKA